MQIKWPKNENKESEINSHQKEGYYVKLKLDIINNLVHFLFPL